MWSNQKFVVASLLDAGAAQMSGGVQIVNRPAPYQTPPAECTSFDASSTTTALRRIPDPHVTLPWHDVPVESESLKSVGDLIAGPV
jgi:hypothetical protein